ncbi:hypothetical protein B0H11DRAFT_1928339 [Mycena galericulata]|nr:hypothetical protein B0H11DRAFT_1928339 [Mycena galericulata]
MYLSECGESGGAGIAGTIFLISMWDAGCPWSAHGIMMPTLGIRRAAYLLGSINLPIEIRRASNPSNSKVCRDSRVCSGNKRRAPRRLRRFISNLNNNKRGRGLSKVLRRLLAGVVESVGPRTALIHIGARGVPGICGDACERRCAISTCTGLGSRDSAARRANVITQVEVEGKKTYIDIEPCALRGPSAKYDGEERLTFTFTKANSLTRECQEDTVRSTNLSRSGSKTTENGSKLHVQQREVGIHYYIRGPSKVCGEDHYVRLRARPHTPAVTGDSRRRDGVQTGSDGADSNVRACGARLVAHVEAGDSPDVRLNSRRAFRGGVQTAADSNVRAARGSTHILRQATHPTCGSTRDARSSSGLGVAGAWRT